METPENRLNYARYICLINKLIPCVMVQIHQWLYMGGSLGLEKYLESETKLNRFNVKEKELISKGVDISKMDVQLLYKLLRHTCGLAKSDEAWHRSCQPGEKRTLEKELYTLKIYRNKASHSDPTDILKVSDGDLEKTVKELKDLFMQALKLAGIRGRIKKKKIATAITKIERDLQEERFAESCFTVSQFTEKCHEEIELQSNIDTQFSPDLYLQPRLLVEENNPSTGMPRTQEIICKDLLAHSCHDSSRPEVLILVGETGAGKSSLCRHVLRTWLRCPQEMKNLDKFQLVLRLDCNEIRTRDIDNYLHTNLLPKAATSCSDTSEVKRLMSKMKVLWVLDGWDEATPEAKELVKELLTTQPDSHTVLVTSRPEMSHDLLTNYLAQKNSILITFANLSKPEREELVKKYLHQQAHENMPDSCKDFIANPDINTPLQLVLMTNLSMADVGNMNAQKPLSLIQLYTAIEKQQKLHLVEKYKEEVTEECAAAVVDKYFKCVCKVAFNTINNGHILKLDKSNIKLLKVACQPCSPTQAFSTFFTNDNILHSSASNAEYSFRQESLRVFYAALHIKHICSKAKCPDSTLVNLLDIPGVTVNSHVRPCLYAFQFIKRFLKQVTYQQLPSNEQPKNLIFYYPVLLIVLELISDGRFGTSVSSRCLVNLLSHIIGENASVGKWFEVLRSGNFQEDLVKEISGRVNHGAWHVVEGDLRAAHELLQYVAPNEITIDISGDTGSLLDFTNTLHRLAQRIIRVNLSFNRRFQQIYSCEEYLEILCNDDSKCILKAYMGDLTKNGMELLKKSSQLEILRVRVTKENAINSLIENVKSLTRLSTLHLVYDLRKFVKPAVPLDGSQGILRFLDTKKAMRRFTGSENLDIYLELPHLKDVSLNSAITFISKLNKHYKSLNVGNLHPKYLKNLEKGLKNNDVSYTNLVHFPYII